MLTFIFIYGILYIDKGTQKQIKRKEGFKMKYEITESIVKVCKFVIIQGHARINAESVVELELYKQKYGEYPQVFDIWDMEKDIVENAKQIVDTVFNRLYKEGY